MLCVFSRWQRAVWPSLNKVWFKNFEKFRTLGRTKKSRKHENFWIFGGQKNRSEYDKIWCFELFDVCFFHFSRSNSDRTAFLDHTCVRKIGFSKPPKNTFWQVPICKDTFSTKTVISEVKNISKHMEPWSQKMFKCMGADGNEGFGCQSVLSLCLFGFWVGFGLKKRIFWQVFFDQKSSEIC